MLSRRAALKGGTAVACVAVAGTVAAPALTAESNTDAELEALYAEWQAADTAETEVFNRADDARLALVYSGDAGGSWPPLLSELLGSISCPRLEDFIGDVTGDFRDRRAEGLRA